MRLSYQRRLAHEKSFSVKVLVLKHHATVTPESTELFKTYFWIDAFAR